MTNRLSIIILICLFAFCSACNNKNKTIDSIVRVNNNYLSSSDIENIVPENTSIEDSTAIVEAYIASWIRSQLLYQEAQKKISGKDKTLEKLIENYKKSLVIYEYEQMLIKETLDTVVSDYEVNIYYENHKENFELKKNIVKVIYIITEKNYNKSNLIKKILSSKDTLDYIKLDGLKHDNEVVGCYTDYNKWIPYNDLTKLVPIVNNYTENYIKNNRYLDFHDENYHYYVLIKDFKMGEGIYPLDFVYEDIKNIIINKRKKKIIFEVEEELYKTALKNNNIEIFN